MAALDLALRTAIPDALAPLEQCHGGGKDATRALAHQVEVTAGMRGLDGGGGLGGAARMPLWPLSRDLRPALLLVALPSASLRRLSRPRYALCRGAGCAARAVGKAWPPAGGARGLQGGALLSASAKCLVEFLAAQDQRQKGTASQQAWL